MATSRAPKPAPAKKAPANKSVPAKKAPQAGKTGASQRRAGTARSRSGTQVHWSREATGLLWCVGGILLGIVAYSGLFGGLGRALFDLGRDVVGVTAFMAYVVAAIVGGGVVVKYTRLPRHALVIAGVLVASIASIDGAVEVGSRSHLVLPGPTFGGIVGNLVGYGVTRVAGSVGGTIVLVVIALVCVLGLVGLRPRESMNWLVQRLGTRSQPDQAARATEPVVTVDGQELAAVDDDAVVGAERRPEARGRRGKRRGDQTPVDGSVSPETGSNVAHAGEAGLVQGSLAEPDVGGSSLEEAGLLQELGTPTQRSRHDDGQWRLPSPSLLKRGSRAKIDRADLERRGRVLETALGSHGVSVKVAHMTVGPTVTRYELELAEGVKVARVLALQRDIAYAMAATDVRILAPIPGKSAIGVEVPNRVREVVTLGDVLASPQMERATKVLDVPLGRDISGTAAVFDIAAMPHVLVAGSTGSGKSSLINSLLTSLLMRNTPQELRLILVDPKRVELSQYNALPHLLTSVVVDPKKAAHALNWAVEEMERRYDILAHWGVRDIVGYRDLLALSNGADDPDEGPPEELPYILVVIDELNDLMMAAPRDVEDSICRIAQKARAVGVHLVIATQRPSVDVITGVIKTNVPSRIAFAVASQTDSRVILDQLGAEKLVGKGDLLMVTATSSQPRRLQAPWVSEQEVAAIVGHWRRQGTPSYLEELDKVEDAGRPKGDLAAEVDPLFSTAAHLIVDTGAGSTSMLQRRLKVGFARAGRLMDLLEDRGIVGPADGSKQRQVLVTPEELEELDI